jgi:hypothetical protein
MEQQEIRELAESYGQSLGVEYEAKADANAAATEVERIASIIIGAGYADGTIDGKNAETRKAQEREALAKSPEYTAAKEAQAIADDQAALNEINRKQLEALVSLTKAWLYSQAGR